MYTCIGSASERAKGWGCLGTFRSCSPLILPHVIGQVRYGRGRKGKHECWKQSLACLSMFVGGCIGEKTSELSMFDKIVFSSTGEKTFVSRTRNGCSRQ